MRSYPTPRGYVTEHGYRRFMRKDRTLKFEHVLVWEAHYGPIPAGYQIHHINGDKLDNRRENLQLVTRLEHKRIHSGCYRVGNTWLKRCRRCQWLRPIDTDYYEYSGSTGVMGVCRRCASELAIAAKRKRRARRQTQEVQQARVAAGTVAERWRSRWDRSPPGDGCSQMAIVQEDATS